jgi:hypothetical protein
MKTAQLKIAQTVAGLLLVAGGATACGDDGGDSSGGSSAPDQDKGTSTAEFCGAFQAFYDDLTALSGDEPNLGEILKKAAKRIEDVGTPDDIPDDAEQGLELTLDAIDGLPDDATAQDMEGLESGFTDEDKKKTDAFSTYLDKTCPDIGGGAESPSDVPTASIPTPSESASGGS